MEEKEETKTEADINGVLPKNTTLLNNYHGEHSIYSS